MEMISRSFRLERGSSRRLGRSNSSLLGSELVSSARITGYERLSESMRLTQQYCNTTDHYRYRPRKNRAWSFLAKVFSFRKTGDQAAETSPQTVATAVEEKKKRRSSWLPDPNQRWPVQGW